MGNLWIHEIGPGELVLLFGVYTWILFKFLTPLVAFSILICTIAAIYYYLDQHNEYWHKKGVPGPKGNILFGSLLELFKSQHEFDRINTEKYGETFGTMLLGTPELVTNDLDFIQQVLIKNFDAFPDRLDVAKSTKDELRGNFLTVKRGDDWRRIRHRITPAFTSSKMKRLINVMHLCSKELLKNLEGFSKTGEDVPLKDTLSKLTMNVIGKSVFAADLNSFDETNSSPFLNYASKFFKINLTDPIFLILVSFPNLCGYWTKLTGKAVLQPDVIDYFTTTLNYIMDERLKDPEAPKNVSRAEKDKKTVSRGEVLAQLVIFLAAGYETTASTLHYVCYILSHRPEIQDKLREEVLSVLDGKETIEYDDMKNLEYMDQVINETLRMYPPAVRLNRLCQKNIELNGIEIEKDSAFSFDVYNIHHDPNNYPDPYEFDPERFTPENKAARHPMAFLPFGAGPRICLGMRFAEYEMRVALTDLIKNFEFLPSEGMPGLPVPIISTTLLKPAFELKCKVRKL
uniref:Cytochrome P450 n=1 Tax=Panagrolaimus sp. JU765 TaxID=591449 RepID=A0AC34RMV4_9BILA